MRSGLVVLSVLLIACGGAGFQVDDALGSDSAPEVAAAVEARDEALAREDLVAAGDHQTRARLLQEADALSSTLATLEREEETLVLAERELLASLREQDQATLRERAAAERVEAERVVEGQAAAAFDRADEEEPRRHRNQRRERRMTRKRAARVMARRTRLTLEAARGFGASDEEMAAAQTALAHAQDVLEGTSAVDAVVAAERAWTSAQAVLRAARAAQPERPTPEQASMLMQRADEQGFVLSHTPRGASLVMTGAVSETQIERVVALAQAYPLGPIQVDSREGSIPMARRQSADLIAALLAVRGAGQVHGEVSTGRARLEVVFTAYVLGP